LGLKNGSQTGVDCVDVRYVLAAFEELNKCKLSVLIRVSGTQARPVMDLEVQADPLESAAAEPVPLALAKCTIGSTGTRTMEAAILQALYALDAQLAERELARADRK
jgi:hypothetical protein